jgi:putative transposase
MNIRAEGIRMSQLLAGVPPVVQSGVLSSSGTGEANANGEEVRPIRGRKPKMRHSSVKLEARLGSSR